MDRLFIDVPNYCGPKTHVFKDQDTNEVISWITYVPDSLGSGTLSIDPQVNAAADIRMYTIEWTASLTNYLSVAASPAYIFTVDVQCPISPTLSTGTQVDYSVDIDYIIGSGPQYFSATPVIDSTNGFCFILVPSLIKAGAGNGGAAIDYGTYDYVNQRYEILTSEITLAGQGKNLKSTIGYQTNILILDLFHVNFIAMSYDCTNTVLDSAFYTDPGTAYTWKLNASPASSSVQISEPTDTIAVTAGSSYACGQR